MVRNATVHVLSRCPRWAALRAVLLPGLLVPAEHSDRSDAVALAFLRARPGDVAFRQALALADELAEEAKQFWMNR